LLLLFGRPVLPTISAEDWTILKKAFGKDWTRLAELADIYVGEVFDNAPNKKYLSDDPIGPVVLRGANIDRYLFRQRPTQGRDRFLRTESFLQDKAKSTKIDALYQERVGLQRGAAVDNWRRLIGCRIPGGFFSFDTILLLNPHKIHLHVLLALVNSDLWEWRFRSVSATNHVNAYEMEGFVVPPVLLDETSPAVREIIGLVADISDEMVSGVRRSETQIVPEDSPDFRIDRIIYEAYGLDIEAAAYIRARLHDWS
jgi:hypothetical protein